MKKTRYISHGYPTYSSFYIVEETNQISLLTKLKVVCLVTNSLYSVVLPAPVIPSNLIEQRQNRGLSKIDEVFVSSI
jgi:hypothetical protein